MDMVDILSELNDHGFEDVGTPRKIAVINDTIWDICSREPWPFLETTAEATIDSNGVVTNPTDISKVLAFVNTTRGYALNPERLDVITKSFASDLSYRDYPKYYYFIGDSLRVYPLTNTGSSDVFTLRYLKHHPALTDSSVEADILLPIRHQRAVVLGALLKLYSMEDDPELAALFAEQFEARLQTMREDLWKKQYDRPQRIYVVDDDDYYDYY